MLGHSTTKVIRLVRRLVEQYRERKMNLHIVFIDLERPMTKFLERLYGVVSVHVAYTREIKDIFDEVKTQVRTVGGDLEHLPGVTGFPRDQFLARYYLPW